MPELDKMHRGKVIQESEKDKVKVFFNSDEVSRMCPGARDYVVIRNELGEKEKVQKRLILGTLKEAYRQFKEDSNNPSIGFSSFCALRPRNCVLAGSAGTHAVCVCVYHQNVKLMIDSLGGRGLSYYDLIDHAVCDSEREQCMVGTCENCPGEAGVDAFLQLILDEAD